MTVRPDSISPQFRALLAIHSDAAGHLQFDLTPLEPHVAFTLPFASLILSIWADSDNAIRARFEHEPSGAVAYIQGNESLLSFRHELGMVTLPARSE